jgi:uncharacterized protein YndB with AHSA1/START domain
MPDAKLERDFAVPVETLYAYVTEPARLAEWFGPEGTDLTDAAMDFTRPGPWHAVMVARDSGNRFKVSGQVTHVRPMTSVGLTWAWHDDSDQRGAESHVTFAVAETSTGSRLIIDHRDLADATAVARHTAGWTATLAKLTRLLTSPQA